jgi:hypothetical protein
MAESGISYKEKCLTEDEISSELLADTLSDVPEDADSDSGNDSDSSIIGNRQNKIVHPLLSYSDDNEQSANEINDDETLDSEVSTWVNTDKTKFRAIDRKPRGETNYIRPDTSIRTLSWRDIV